MVIGLQLRVMWQIFSSFFIFCFNFIRVNIHEINYKLWETRKIFAMLIGNVSEKNHLKLNDSAKKTKSKSLLLSNYKSEKELRNSDVLCATFEKWSTFSCYQ